MFKSNFLQSHQVLCQFTATFVHSSISALQTERAGTGGQGQTGRPVQVNRYRRTRTGGEVQVNRERQR